jgi:hypothetical protein
MQGMRDADIDGEERVWKKGVERVCKDKKDQKEKQQ